jgi:hypothetical protein
MNEFIINIINQIAVRDLNFNFLVKNIPEMINTEQSPYIKGKETTTPKLG